MSVRHAILGLLHERPRHGYDVRAAFEALVGGPAVWDLKAPQVYTTLARLERDELVEPVETQRIGGPARVVFRLTDSGREELRSWFGQGVHGQHVRDEFFVKLMVAVATPEADTRDIIRIQRSTLFRDLHALTNRRSKLDRGCDLARAMLLDKAIMHLEADLRWLDMVEARLADIELQPVAEPLPRRRGRPPKEDPNHDPSGEAVSA